MYAVSCVCRACAIGASETQCVAKGCCWDPKSPKAWCYHKGDPALNVTNPETACPNHHNTWSDCGKGGISEADCLKKGCCWDPKSPRAWCYHKGVIQRPVMSWFALMVRRRAAC